MNIANWAYQGANGAFSLLVIALAWYGAVRYRSAGLAALAMGRALALVTSLIFMMLIGMFSGGGLRSVSMASNSMLLTVVSLISGIANYGFAVASVLLLMRDFKRYKERTEAAEALVYRVNRPTP